MTTRRPIAADADVAPTANTARWWGGRRGRKPYEPRNARNLTRKLGNYIPDYAPERSWVTLAAEHGMAYEEVGEGGDARAPFTSLIRSLYRPSALARTAAKGEVEASSCTPFATVGTFC